MSTPLGWGHTVKAKIKWFHMNSGNRVNANAYYSAGVDRIFAVDNFDPYTSLECAQILSSKMPCIAILILNRNEITGINNANCFNFTVQNKNPNRLGSALLSSHHWPVIRKMTEPQLIFTEDWPEDYRPGTRNHEIFLEFHNYAKFVIRAWHAAKICEMAHNVFPMDLYKNKLFRGIAPDDFRAPIDADNEEFGITDRIRQILYFANSIRDALDQLEAFWLNFNTPFSERWREFFYYLLESVEEPESLKSLRKNIENYGGYLV